MTELKPCPFDGYKPNIWQGSEESNKRWFVQCPKCHIFQFGDNRKEAIQAWNKREVGDDD